MKKKIIFILLISIQVILLLLYFVDFNWQHTKSLKDDLGESSESERLSEQCVNAFIQDKSGQMWIGTNNGLNVYVGKKYHHFYYATNDSTTIPDNKILSLLCDSKGSIWVGTPNGVARYYGCHKFKRYNIPFTAVGAFQLADYGESGVVVNNGKDAYIIKGDEVSLLCHFSSYYDSYSFVYPDRSGGFWTLQPMKASHYSKDKRLDKVFTTPIEVNLCFTYLCGDTVWYSQGIMLSAIDLRTNKRIYTSKKRLPIIPTSICPKDKNTVYVNSKYHGLYSIDIKTDALTKLSDGTIPLRHKDVTISTLYSDVDNNLWVGYLYGGFQIVSPNTIAFESVNNKPINELTSGQPVMQMGTTNGNIVGGTEDGLFCYDVHSKRFTKYLYSNIFSDSPFFRQTMEDVVAYKDSKLWIITNVRIISCELQGGEIKILRRVFSREKTGPLLGRGVRVGDDVLVTSNSRYLIKSRFGSNECDSILVDSDVYGSESVLLRLPDDRVLIVMKGLEMALYDQSSGAVKPFAVQKSDDLVNAMPNVVFMDGKNNVWIGTKHNGLCHLDYKNKVLSRVESLPIESVQSIQDDGAGRLWISSTYDLLLYDTADSTVRVSSIPLNLEGHELRYNAACKLADNNSMFLATSRGCITLPINYIDNETKHDVKIHSLLIETDDGRRMGVNSQFQDGEHYTFSHDENTLTIDFASATYGSRERWMYQYKMEGYDNDWSAPTLLPHARYTNLPHGDYRFRVRMIASKSSKALSESEITISIKSSVWTSAAAWFFYVVCATLLVVYLQRMFLRRQKDKLRIEHLMEEQRREKRNSEMIMNFFANISHEFRNPLTLISGPLLALRADKTLPTSVQKSLNIVCVSVNRMLTLIDQMLDFNKLETDALRLNVAECDVVSKLRSLIVLFRETAKHRGIDVVFDSKDDNLYVWADLDKLEKIMSNLFINALKHTPDGGKIVVKVSVDVAKPADFPNLKDGSYVRVSVYDNGKHIDADKLQDIFKCYYQVKGTQSTHQYGWGTGLGLYYVKRLLLLHHGGIKVQNEEAEGGVLFVFVLPTEKNAYTEAEREQRAEVVMTMPTMPLTNDAEQNVEVHVDSVNRATHKPVILVVDDDVSVAQYIRSLFVDDYVVVNKYSAEDALDNIENIKPDIILSDVVMGDMDGYTFCRKVKGDIATSHIPVVLITAKSGINEQVEGVEGGANAYITKPFDPRYLCAVVANQLNNIRILRERLSKGDNAQGETEGLSAPDKNFLDSLYALMEKHIAEQDISIGDISRELLISQSKLNYKLKELTGETPGSFFRKYKLNKAAKLLHEGKYNVSEVAYMTGFGTASHFSVAFKKQFGLSPSEYQ